MDLRMKEYHNVIDPNTHAEMIVDTSDDSIAVDVSNKPESEIDSIEPNRIDVDFVKTPQSWNKYLNKDVIPIKNKESPKVIGLEYISRPELSLLEAHGLQVLFYMADKDRFRYKDMPDTELGEIAIVFKMPDYLEIFGVARRTDGKGFDNWCRIEAIEAIRSLKKQHILYRFKIIERGEMKFTELKDDTILLSLKELHVDGDEDKNLIGFKVVLSEILTFNMGYFTLVSLDFYSRVRKLAEASDSKYLYRLSMYIMSRVGDDIINRDYRFKVVRNMMELAETIGMSKQRPSKTKKTINNLLNKLIRAEHITKFDISEGAAGQYKVEIQANRMMYKLKI